MHNLFPGMVAILLATGCTSQQTPGTTEAIAGLAKRKNLSQQWARELKGDSNLDAATLKTGRAKYIEAASDNKGLSGSRGQRDHKQR